MPARAESLLRCVRRVASRVQPAADDSELLTRFLTDRDPAAFETLVARHGPMVLRVCQRVLENRHDAEDAFQATFLVLARKAASVQPPGALAGWLHGVAGHVALRARTAALRRRHESLAPEHAPPDPRPDPLAALTALEALRIVEEEVQRLPEAYRLPLVLCCLHGVTQDEAARQLGWTPGSLKGRLERGRKRLHQRLTRRGLGLPAALTIVEVSFATPNGLARTLAASTVEAAVAFSSRSPGGVVLVSARVAALAEAGLRHGAVTKAKFGLLVLLALGVVTAELATRVVQLSASEPPDVKLAAEPGQSPREASETRPPNEEDQTRSDRHGEPLPEGAVHRFGSARFRHAGAIRASALSSDGKLLATAGDHSVIVWELDGRRPLHRFPCDQGSTFVRPALTFSTDGTRLGYVRGSFFACVWDLRTGKELRRFERRFEDGYRKFWSNCCQFANGNRDFVIASGEAIETRDLQSGTPLSSVPVTAQVSLLSPDGKTYFRTEKQVELVSGNTRTGHELTRWKVSIRREGSLACSPDGKSVAVVHEHQEDKEIQVRETIDGKVLASFPLPASARHTFANQRLYWEFRVTFSADGKTLLLGTYGGIIHRWDLASGQELPPLCKHRCTVTGMHILPDGRTLVSTGEDGVIRRWNLKSCREEFEPESYEGRSNAAYSPDGRFVAVGDARGRIDLWDGRNGKLIRTLQQDGAAVTHLAFAPDSGLLATTQSSGTVKFWHVLSGQPGDVWQHEPVRGEWFCNGLHFSPDGRWLCISDYPKQIRLVEVTTGKLLWTGPCSYAEAFSPDGATLLVAETGPYLAMLDATTGKQLTRIKLNVDLPDLLGVWCTLAFSPVGRQLAVAPDGGTLMLCDSRTCAETQRLVTSDAKAERMKVMSGSEPTNQVRTLAFSPDGKWLASGGSDTAVSIREAVTGKEVLRLAGHEAEVSTVAFSPNEQKVFSYGADGQGYLWSLKPKPTAGPRTTLNELWNDLASTDASKAHRAVRALAEDPGAVQFLQNRLISVALPDEARMAKLIADLDNDSFDVRSEAGRELEHLEALAEAPLRKTLAGRPSAEVRRRAKELLGALSEGVTPATLRAIRATAVLEYNASPEARQYLETLTRGAAEARLTREAKASLERLSRRQTVKP